MRILILTLLIAAPATAAPVVPQLRGLPIIEPAAPAPAPCADPVCPRET